MSRLTRYSFRPGMYGNSMVVSERGPWVHADDAEAAIQAERARIIELVEAQRKSATRDQWETLCRVLAAIRGEA